MKKSLIALCLTCALVLVARADDEDKKAEAGKKNEATPEQKAARKAILEKYDTDKDGKLSPEERAKISEEDKAKMKAARANAPKKEKSEKSDTAK